MISVGKKITKLLVLPIFRKVGTYMRSNWPPETDSTECTLFLVFFCSLKEIN